MASNSQKIVHIGEYSTDALNGVAVTLYGQINTLKNLGYPVEIWTFTRNVSEITNIISTEGMSIYLLPLFRFSFLGIFAFPKITRSWIKSRISDVRCIHLHSVFSPANNLVAQFGIPYAVTPNGGWEPSVLTGRKRLAKLIWVAQREKKLWSNARFIQAVSETEERNLSILANIAPIKYIPNGIDLPSQNDKKQFIKRDLWLYMGRLAIQQKGLDILINAYAILRITSSNLPRLILAGPDFRGDKKKIEKMIIKHGLSDDIQLIGPVKNGQKEALLDKASLFLHLSRWEGMPLAILEAMAHGVPCLVTKGTNMAHFVSRGRAGIVAGDTIDEIVAAMLNALKVDLHEMGRSARKIVEHHFTWDLVATRLIAAYDQYFYDRNE